ncbi:MAG: type II toxin-antitoxin system ParD family antitoxin [Alphaproteobacteria bacterium]|nr:type II toxin-antitoxin system ParD family antitoxin [Alphaproteobacteria bacterium]
MPTRNISLTKQLDDFVDATLRKGSHQNASEVVRDALRLLEARQTEEELKLRRLREAIAVGIADHERGDYVEIRSRAALRKVTQQLGRPAKKAAKPAR